MSKSVFGSAIALSIAGFCLAPTPGGAADYSPPPPPPPAYYPPPPPVSSCCCPTVRRGLFSNFSFCGSQGAYYGSPGYGAYPQPYAAPAYYSQPYYGPSVGVGVGPVGAGIGYRPY